jgi:hypothetical protein
MDDEGKSMESLDEKRIESVDNLNGKANEGVKLAKG